MEPDAVTDYELPSFRLDGRIAIITGASDGIGSEFALAYARAGAELVLSARREQALLELQHKIEAVGSKAHVIRTDVSRVNAVRDLAQRVNEIVDRRPMALVLVNCAGFGFTKSALDVSEEDWDLIFGVHVKGTFFCCQMVGRMMIERGYGKIINLSSTWSVTSDTGKSVYGAAKGAVSQLTAALSTEWSPLGVRVNAIAPTTTLTSNTKRTLEQDAQRAQRLLTRIKLGRFAHPSDLIGAAIFLASPASDFITGQTLFVDGGWTADR